MNHDSSSLIHLKIEIYVFSENKRLKPDLVPAQKIPPVNFAPWCDIHKAAPSGILQFYTVSDSAVLINFPVSRQNNIRAAGFGLADKLLQIVRLKMIVLIDKSDVLARAVVYPRISRFALPLIGLCDQTVTRCLLIAECRIRSFLGNTIPGTDLPDQRRRFIRRTVIDKDQLQIAEGLPHNAF